VIDAQVQGMEEISEQKWKEPDRRHRPASCCHLSYCSLDVHRRRREPKLDLDAASPSETRPSQPVELFGETECALDEGLPFGEPLLALGTADTILCGLDEVQRPGAMEGAFNAGRSALGSEDAVDTCPVGRPILNPLSPLQIRVTPQLLAGWAEVGILLGQPGKVFPTPDASVLVAKASGRYEGWDTGLVEIEVVGAGAVLGVRDYFWNAEAA